MWCSQLGSLAKIPINTTPQKKKTSTRSSEKCGTQERKPIQPSGRHEQSHKATVSQAKLERFRLVHGMSTMCVTELLKYQSMHV